MPVNTETEVSVQESDLTPVEFADAEIDDAEQLEEAEIASIGGWQEVELGNSHPIRHHAADANLVPLLDEDDRVTPEQLQQEHPWWMQPLPRMIVTGSAVTGLLYAMFSMFGLWGSSTEKPSSNLVATDATAIDAEVTARINQLQTENENLKRQQFMVEPLSPPTPKPQQASASQSQVQKSQPKVAKTVTIPPKQRIVYVTAPRRATKTRTTTNSNRLTSQPPVRPVPRVPPPKKEVSLEIDPTERLRRAANVGSYSSRASNAADEELDIASNQLQATKQAQSETINISTDEGLSGGTGDVPSQATNQLSSRSNYAANEQVMPPSEFNNSPNTTYTSNATQPSQITPQNIGSNNSPNAYQANTELANPSISQPYTTSNNSSNTYQNNNQLAPSSTSSNDSSNSYQTVSYTEATRNLIIGTRAEGKLETPIAWSGQLQNPNQSFLIRLSEPLTAADGSVAVKKGDYLVARVEAATNAGMVQMSAIAVLSTVNGRTTEQPLPAGAILILGKGGRPLMAKSNRRSGVGNNLGIALLSGASAAAGVANQVSSQSVFGSGGSFSSTTSSDDPNYVAGFGQGVTQSLARQMQNRSQQTQQRLDSMPAVFSLNQGTAVQVFVNQSVSF